MSLKRGASTGVLLVHDSVLLHYLEAPASVCIELLREAQELGRSRPTFGQVRVLVASEDCDRRHFKDWSSHTVEVSCLVLPRSQRAR
jgi:hypothetical protein